MKKELRFFFLGILAVGLMNPAVLCCGYLLIFKDWSEFWYLALFVIWLISYSNYLCNRAIWWRTYRDNALDAADAIRNLSRGYHAAVSDVGTLVAAETLSALKIGPKNISVWHLSPMPGFRPFLNFKAFLLPPSEVVSSIIFIAKSSKPGPAQRFFLLHEVCHITEIGHFMHLNQYATWVRLYMGYLPLFNIVQFQWIPSLVLGGLFSLQVLVERSIRFLENETDRSAWSAYIKSFGLEEALAASRVLEGAFRRKAQLGHNPTENLDRAKIATDFRQQAPGRKFLVLSAVQLHAFSVAVSFCGALFASRFATSSKPPFPLIPIGLVVMWIGLFFDGKNRSQFAEAYHQLYVILSQRGLRDKPTRQNADFLLLARRSANQDIGLSSLEASAR
jgi:hypothetical protein